jgi:cation:H+ antiporter
MSWIFFAITFIVSCFILSWLSSRLVGSLVLVAKYLRWKEFIIAFFVMAFAASLPNLFVDLNAVLHGLPELAFGDIIGGNLVDLTLVLAIAVFFSRNGLSSQSEMVQKTAIFTTVIAVLPLLLVFDGKLDRIDGLVLIIAFLGYSFWLFSKKERFKKTYKNVKESPIKGFKHFLINIIKMIILLLLLLAASQAVVSSAQFFSEKLGISIALVGILIVALGNCFPELYFSIISARKDENWLVLGDLMGSVIVCSTLVLGIIALVSPFEITNLSLFFTARVFLIISAILSLLFIRSGHKITKKEGMALLFIYITFLLVEVFI